MTAKQRKIAEMLLSDIEEAQSGQRQTAVEAYRTFMIACDIAIKNETGEAS